MLTVVPPKISLCNDGGASGLFFDTLQLVQGSVRQSGVGVAL